MDNSAAAAIGARGAMTLGNVVEVRAIAGDLRRPGVAEINVRGAASVLVKKLIVLMFSFFNEVNAYEVASATGVGAELEGGG